MLGEGDSSLSDKKKNRGAGGWKEEAQTSGWVDQPGDYLNLLTFSASTPTRLRTRDVWSKR